MISDRSYNAITRTVEKVVSKLNEHNIKHEVQGDKHTLALAPACSIHTQFCTIDIWKNEIKVNELPAENVDHMIRMIQDVE